MVDQVQGLRELDAALALLPKAVARRELQKDAVAALEPFVEKVRQLAPVDANPASSPDRPPGTLRDSYIAGTRLNRSQARTARREGKSFAEAYAGTNDPAGVQTEFGNAHQAAQPHARPAWDATHAEVLSRVGRLMWSRLEAALARVAKRANGGQ